MREETRTIMKIRSTRAVLLCVQFDISAGLGSNDAVPDNLLNAGVSMRLPR